MKELLVCALMMTVGGAAGVVAHETYERWRHKVWCDGFENGKQLLKKTITYTDYNGTDGL